MRQKFITTGTSGRSSDLVASEIAVSVALVKAENEEIRTYPIEAALTLAGTNAAASLDALARKINYMTSPATI